MILILILDTPNSGSRMFHVYVDTLAANYTSWNDTAMKSMIITLAAAAPFSAQIDPTTFYFLPSLNYTTDIGSNYRGWAHFYLTSGGTGVQDKNDKVTAINTVLAAAKTTPSLTTSLGLTVIDFSLDLDYQ